MKLCYEAHHGQEDKGGMPYVFHPYHVAEQMTDEDCAVVALLHDVVEDTDYTIDQIRGMGFGDDVVEALECLTHREGEDYMDYIRKIRLNPIAKKVKLADLEHNSDTARLFPPAGEDYKRVEKYNEARKILLEE